MKKLVLILFIILGLVFSSCAGSYKTGGGSSDREDVDIDEKDTRGNGLDVDFDLDGKWLGRSLNYDFRIENTGNEPITITQGNFRLGSTNLNLAGTAGVFDDNSVSNFYNRIFESGELIVYKDQVIELTGPLEIGVWFFDELSNEEFEWFLEVDYEYKTEISTNLDVDRSKVRNVIYTTESLSQAAPIQITKIESTPIDEKNHRIDFRIEDKGRSSGESKVTITNLNLELGSISLDECIYIIEEEGNKKKLEGDITLKGSRNEVFYSCKVNFESYDKDTPTGVILNGEIDYEYEIRIEDTEKLPEGRGDVDLFE